MRLNGFRRTIAAVMALVIVGGAMPAAYNGSMRSVRTITANAVQEGTVTFEKSFDMLMLGGAITAGQINEYVSNPNVKKIYAKPGTVLPQNCICLFKDFTSVTEIDLRNADSSNVVYMDAMFQNCENLTLLNLSNFNTTNVESMCSMFADCKNLESIDLSSFDTRNVTNMRNMFASCSSLKSLDLSSFDTGNVKTMHEMFGYCRSLTSLNLKSFNTRNVTDLGNMFVECNALVSLDLSSFEPSSATDMSQLFYGCQNLESINLSRFDTSNVTNISHMFDNCSSLKTLDLSSFDTSNATDMSGMFSDCSYLETLDLSRFDTSNVTNMSCMFSDCSNLENLDLSRFDTSNVTGMGGMFYNCSNLKSLNLSSFDTKNVTSMYRMFSCCKNLGSIDLSRFDTSSVTDMIEMFNECQKLEVLDLSSFDTSNVTDMNNIFGNCFELTTISVSDTWKTPETSKDLFLNCNKLVGDKGTVCKGNVISSEYARIDGGAENPGYFTYGEKKCYSFDEATGIVTLHGNVTKKQIEALIFSSMNAKIKKIVAENTAVLPADTYNLFCQLDAVTEIDLSKADFSNVNCIDGWFYKCPKLVTIDISGDANRAFHKMGNAFSYCPKLKTIYVSKNSNFADPGWDDFDDSNMFAGCTSLVGSLGTRYSSSHIDSSYAHEDASNNPGYFTAKRSVTFDTATQTLYIGKGYNKNDLEAYKSSAEKVVVSDYINIDNPSQMFKDFTKLREANLSKASFSNASNMTSMFQGCSSLYEVKFSQNVDTSNVKHMDNMFKDCASLMYPGISNFDTSNVTSMSNMFSGCLDLTYLNLSNFNTENVWTFSQMFMNCLHLEYINLAGFKTVNLPGEANNRVDLDYMFYGCNSLRLLNLSSFDTRKVKYAENMFQDCSWLKTIFVGDGWNLSNCTNSDNMFKGCTSLTGGQGTKFDSSKTDKTYACLDTANNAGYLSKLGFEISESDGEYVLILKGNVSTAGIGDYRDFATKITASEDAVLPADCYKLFYNFKCVTEIDLSKADTSNVTDMSYMFNDCSRLTSLDLSSFDTSNVTNMAYMFSNCSNLTSLNLSSFDTSNVKSMRYMFCNCKSLTSLDLSSFNTFCMDDFENMFANCSALKTVYATYWFATYWAPREPMFYGCDSLVGGKGTKYNSSLTEDSDYAYVDGVDGKKGYFTSNDIYEIEFKHNCSFNNDLSMYYAVPKSELEGYSNIRLKVSKEEYAEGASKPTIKEKTLTSYSETTISGEKYYMFAFDGITSTDMGSKLKATLYADKGGATYLTKTDIYSVKEYVSDRLEYSKSETYKKMLVDMLNYGAAAQVHFNKNASDLVNKDLTSEQRALGTQTLPTLNNKEKLIKLSGATAEFKGKNIVFGNKTNLAYRMTFPTNQNMSNVKLKISYKTSKGVSVTNTIPASSFTKDGNYYIAYIDTIAITDVRSVISATLYDGNKAISDTLEYSIESYAKNRLSNSNSESYKTLIKEMMKFGISAETHFS